MGSFKFPLVVCLLIFHSSKSSTNRTTSTTTSTTRTETEIVEIENGQLDKILDRIKEVQEASLLKVLAKYKDETNSLMSVYTENLRIMVNESRDEQKEMHDPNVYPTILGGVSRGFWSPFLDFGARSAIFWHLKMGTFGKSARLQVPKNGTSSAQSLQQTPKTPRNTPQNGGVDIWIMHFHFRASIKPNFENF